MANIHAVETEITTILFFERIIEKSITDKTHPKAVKSDPHKQRAKKLIIIPPKIAPLFLFSKAKTQTKITKAQPYNKEADSFVSNNTFLFKTLLKKNL